MENYLKIVRIDESSITPKYIQLINSILYGLQSGEIEKGKILPSINEFSCTLGTARNTVEKAYKELKKMDIIRSIPGKGYFVIQTEFEKPIKILLLFNKLSTHKKIIYDAFTSSLGDNIALDLYIYNSDYNLFKKILKGKINEYAKFVIIPHFIENKEEGYNLINTLPKERLVLMDKLIDNVKGEFGAVYENFETDIFCALEELNSKLSKYKTLNIIFPTQSCYSKKILIGFLRFCYQYNFNYNIISCLTHAEIEKSAVYIILIEDDLVELIERSKQMKLKVGKDIGIISYNETPSKRIMLDGITTISTDFKMMGEKAAEILKSNSIEHIEIPFKIICRKSL